MLQSTLDIPREECRGILRRLELESYSNVISTFRAQGGLNDLKKRILEDLRGVFHISQDRHRAEVRRVANDEKLCTIADNISGPNTTQEWYQEGKRSYPLLSRNFAYTAFSAVANTVTEKIVDENSKLPSLDEVRKQKEEIIEKMNIAIDDEEDRKILVVKEDPLVPFLEEKKKIKRPHSFTEQSTTSISSPPPLQRKRTISNSIESSKRSQDQQLKQEQQQQQQQLISEQDQNHTNLRIQQLYHNHCKTVSRHKKSTSSSSSSTTKRKSMQSLGKEIQSKVMAENNNTKIHQQTNKNNSCASINNSNNNILETSIVLMSNNKNNNNTNSNKLNVSLPNPQILHTYASTQNLSHINKMSMSLQMQNNLRTGTDIKPISYESGDVQLKNSHFSTPKKDTTNNIMKLDVSQLKQTPDKKRTNNEKASNALYNAHQKLSNEKGVIPTATTNNCLNQLSVKLNEISSSSFVPFVPVNNSSNKVLTTTILVEKNSNSKVKIPQSSPLTTISTLDSSHKIASQQKNTTEPVNQLGLTIRSTPSSNTSSCSSPTVVQIKPQSHVTSIETVKNTSKESTAVESSSNVLQIQGKSTPTLVNHSIALGTKRKIQITNPQIIHPIKIAPRGLQNIQNCKGVKIISSANGKMFIQPPSVLADGKVITSSSPKLTRIIATTQKNVISTATIKPYTTTAVGNSVNNSSLVASSLVPNRLAVQKVHILPKIGGTKPQISISKPSTTRTGGQIFVQTANITSNTSTASNVNLVGTVGKTMTSIGGVKVTGTPLKNQTSFNETIIIDGDKSENIILPTSNKIIQSTTSTTTNNIISLPVQQSSSQNNVIVIGSVPSQTKKDLRPDIKNLIDNSRINNNNGDDDGDSQLNKKNLITEDTPVYILTAPVANLDKSSTLNLEYVMTEDKNFDSKTLESVRVIDNQEIQEINEEMVQAQTIKMNSEQLSDHIIENIDDGHIEYSEMHNIEEQDNNKRKKKKLVYEVTDWEDELDQEAIRSKNKTKNSNQISSCVQNENTKLNDAILSTPVTVSSLSSSVNGAIITTTAEMSDTSISNSADNENNIIYMADNFNDVIEVEDTDSDSDGIILLDNKGYHDNNNDHTQEMNIINYETTSTSTLSAQII